MAIAQLLAQILTAQYGRDVRQSIHDAIGECYTNVSTAKTLATDATNSANTAAINANEKATLAQSAADAANNAEKYVHIRYADVPAPTDEQMDESVGLYMGVCRTASATAPTTASTYTWNRIQGVGATTENGVGDLQNVDYLRLAKIQYTNFESGYWGTTLEDKARNIAKYDIHVSGAINEYTLPIIERAREINPNLKICAYISVASGRPGADGDWYTFRRGALWDTAYAATIPNITRPSNKWEILQEIETYAHVGGTPTGEQIFIEDYVWTDENNVEHTDPKYINKYEGGVSYDGIFWDDVGFDVNITSGTFYDTDNSSAPIPSIVRQGFKSRRDKYMCINGYTHDCGMFVIPNSTYANDLYSPEVSDENPEGLGASIDSRDFVFIESCLTMVGDTNSVLWRNEMHRVNDYLENWYPIIGAKIICEDYGYEGMPQEVRDMLITYMIATYTAAGVHYFGITNVDNSLYIPESLRLQVPVSPEDRASHLVRQGKELYKLNFAGRSLSVTRNQEITTGDVVSYGVENGTKILLDGYEIRNAFMSGAQAHAELFEEVSDLSGSLTQAISDTKRNSSVYNRLMIDDWGVDRLEYTNLVSKASFGAWGAASADRYSSNPLITVTYDADTRTITWEKDPSFTEDGMQSTDLIIKIGPAHYGHTIEFGYKIHADGDGGLGAWLDAWYEGNLWFEDGHAPPTNTSTFYPEDTGFTIHQKLIPAYDESKESATIRFVGTWNLNCLLGSLTNFYIIDIDEFGEDVTKDEYTNLMPGINGWVPYARNSFAVTPTTNQGFTVFFDEWDGAYENGDGPAWWLSTEEILRPGRTYEIGMFDIEIPEGDSCSFVLDVGSDKGNLCGNISVHRKISSSVYPVNTYNKKFTVPEDVILSPNSLLYLRYFSENGTGKTMVASHWYLHDIDEENVIVRGLAPSAVSIRICRVTDESFAEDQANDGILNNTMYITNTGKMYITDVNRNIIPLIPGSL